MKIVPFGDELLDIPNFRRQPLWQGTEYPVNGDAKKANNHAFSIACSSDCGAVVGIAIMPWSSTTSTTLVNKLVSYFHTVGWVDTGGGNILCPNCLKAKGGDNPPR